MPEIKYANAAPAVLMVRPANFGPNPETAQSNAFQQTAAPDELNTIRGSAIAEFDNAVGTLRSAGVEVLVAQDAFSEVRKDAVFPNNWLSTHPDGRIFLYPMQSAARRTERRQEVLQLIASRFSVNEFCDLSGSENDSLYLEGTGSLILDHQHKTMYASRSIRTSGELAKEQAQRLGLSLVLFDAHDRHGHPIYHTNVLMCLGSHYCVICLECIPEGSEKDALLKSLSVAGYELVDISFQQMEQFAGNMLEVSTNRSKPALVMSASAFGALADYQKNILKKYANLIAIDIPVIEKYGGGSARCMMAGIHLPRNE